MTKHPSADRARRRQSFALLCVPCALALALVMADVRQVGAAPPTPGENPQRDLEALQAAPSVQKRAGVVSLAAIVSPAESRHNARFDEIIKPLRDAALSVDDAERLRQAQKAAEGGNFVEALALKSALRDPAAGKLVDWMILRKDGGDIATTRAFLVANPTWPNRWLLIEHLEDMLLKAGDAVETLATFKVVAPETVVGQVAMALALQATGQREAARKLASKTWRSGDIPAAKEKDLLARLGDLVTADDVAARAKAKKANGDGNWRKTRSRAYDSMKSKDFRSAYKIVKSATGLSVNPLKEQAFLSGWLALRYLDDIDAAKSHFKVMRKYADGPLSRSKSAYWMGRAHEASGDKVTAADHYRAASAEQIDTFHAHLSRQRLNPGAQDIKITPPQEPSQAQIDRFLSLDSVRAAVIADKAGLGKTITRPFLANLGNLAETEAEVALVAHLTRELGDTQQSLRIAKTGVARGMNLIYYAYPLHAFPDYTPLRKPPEPAFLLSVARQESEFNTAIVSSAGARGILQVMPITARHVCRDYGLKCEIDRLLTDESYNTKLSSAYIADRMEEFGGSYVLGLAGYNAGPGRARQWIRDIGDPRDGRIDEVDWIERIPFWETRQYVAKVLSNIQMYRARLGERNALRIEEDLMRAKQPQRLEKRHAPGSKGLTLNSGR